jgi:photosystem II stability/assembly factor-like uncharacterized protein
MNFLSIRINKSVLIIITLLVFSQTYAQQWVTSMQDPNISFFEVQRQFNEYFKNKEYEKGKGWKQFKRWEYFMERRVDSNGFFTHEADAYAIYNQIQNTYYSTARLGQGTAGRWKALGPNGPAQSTKGGAGRLNCIAFHPTNSSFILAGAASGGIWVSTNNGSTWKTYTDDLATLGISHIAFSQSNPSIIYAATGDRDGSDTYSVGIIKSTDGGMHWSSTNLNWPINYKRLVNKVLVHPTNPNIVYASTSYGLYKTTDGGSSWVRKRIGLYKDMEFKPGDPNTIYIATTGSIIRTTNACGSFTTLNINFASNVNRLEMAVTPADPNYLYVIAGKSSDNGFGGLYLSTNGGNTFVTKSTTPNILGWDNYGSDVGGQAWYDLSITVSPTNKNLVFGGGINIWRSTNGGSSWAIKAHWQGKSASYVHADIHSLEYSPHNSNTLWACSDGGASISTANGASWTDKNNGLAIGQMYRMGASKTTANKIMTGWQDNGSSRYTGTWVKVLGGDGMECIIDYSNNNIMYGSVYYGSILRSADGGANWTEITNSINEQGNWVTPYVIHPTAANILYAGYHNIYKSTNKGNSWTKLTNFSGSAKVEALAISPSNPQIMYMSTYNDVKKSTNGGSTWTSINSGLGGRTVTYFAIHPTNPNKVWVSLSGYSDGYKVMKTINGGQSWQNISGTLPNLPANCIVYEKNTADGIYVGMDVGVYYHDNNLNKWVPFMKDLPNVIVNELEIFYPGHKIRAATYGRSMWESDLYALANDIESAKAINNQLHIYPNPSSNKINIDLSGMNYKTGHIRIINNLGKQLKDFSFDYTSLLNISVNNLPSGIYFVEIQTDNEVSYGKFIRQ